MRAPHPEPFVGQTVPDAAFWSRRARETQSSYPSSVRPQAVPPTVICIGPRTSPAASSDHGGSTWEELLQSLSSLYLLGASINWAAAPGVGTEPMLVLPNYPFERRRYWLNLSAPSTRAGDLTPSPEQAEMQSWLYQIIWQPISVPQLPLPAPQLSAPDEIMQSMAASLDSAASAADYSFFPTFPRRL